MKQPTFKDEGIDKLVEVGYTPKEAYESMIKELYILGAVDVAEAYERSAYAQDILTLKEIVNIEKEGENEQ